MPLTDTLRFALRAAELGRVPRWSPARTTRVASARLKSLVAYAAARSPFYARRYRHVELHRLSLPDLPPTNKDELRQAFDDVVTDRRVHGAEVRAFAERTDNLGGWFLGRYAVSHTSGSQGPPLPIVQDRFSLELLFGLMSARANAGRRPGILEGMRRLVSPARVAVVTLHRGFYPSAAAFEYMERMTRPFTNVARFSAADPDLVDKLNHFQPHSLVGYASVLEGLAVHATGLHLQHLRQIANSSEELTPRARRRIERAFGVVVMDHYGVGECLFLADGCPTDGGAHVNADWAIVENVDESYRPVPPGEPGRRVLITNLANRVQPFIRYEVNDRIVMADRPCNCGSRLPRISRIEGRSADALWFPDLCGGHRPLPGVLFHDCIDALGEVREWRVIQEAQDRVRLQLEWLPGHREPVDHAGLRARLVRAGLPDTVRLEIEAVPRLSPDPSTGKFRRVIGLPPEEPRADMEAAS